MNLRFPKSRLLFAALMMSMSAALPAADLKIATVAPEGSSWMKALRAGGAEVSQRTSGRVNLKFYGGGIQGNDDKVLLKMRIGQLQGGLFTSNGLRGRYPDIAIYGLPMLFRSQDEVDYVRERMDPTLVAGLAKAGLTTYGFQGGGFAYLMSNKPVRRLEDLRGQKIWVQEGDETSLAAMKALSLLPQTLQITDVLTGLETGLLDIVATPPVGAVVLQWYTKVKYVTDLPLSYTLGVMAIDSKALKPVSAADQAALRDVLTKLFAKLDAQTRADDVKAIEALRANGLEFVAPDAADLPRWRASIDGAMNELAARGVFSPERLAEVRKLVAEYRARNSGTPPTDAR